MIENQYWLADDAGQCCIELLNFKTMDKLQTILCSQKHVNQLLCEGNESGLFVTCWMGILTLSTGELKFANAGHNAPIIIQNGEIKYYRNDVLKGINTLSTTDYPYLELTAYASTRSSTIKDIKIKPL